jgi:hypothetical protein
MGIQGVLSEPISIRNGARQVDAVACLLFNTGLEGAVRDANLNYERKYLLQISTDTRIGR